MAAPTSYMLYQGKPADAISNIRLSYINSSMTTHYATRNLVYVQMGLQLQNYFNSTRDKADGSWSQRFADELVSCRDQQFSTATYGAGKGYVFNKAYIQALVDNLDTDKIPVVD